MLDVQTAEDVTSHFEDFLSTDAFLHTAAAEEIVSWLQKADPLIVPDALDFMVTRGVVKKFAELFRGSNPQLEVRVPARVSLSLTLSGVI